MSKDLAKMKAKYADMGKEYEELGKRIKAQEDKIIAKEKERAEKQRTYTLIMIGLCFLEKTKIELDEFDEFPTGKDIEEQAQIIASFLPIPALIKTSEKMKAKNIAKIKKTNANRLKKYEDDKALIADMIKKTIIERIERIEEKRKKREVNKSAEAPKGPQAAPSSSPEAAKRPLEAGSGQSEAAKAHPAQGAAPDPEQAPRKASHAPESGGKVEAGAGRSSGENPAATDYGSDMAVEDDDEWPTDR